MDLPKKGQFPPARHCYLFGRPLRVLEGGPECGSCKLTVNACALHGECVSTVSRDGIKSCFRCPDRVPVIHVSPTWYYWQTEGLGI
jgi:hypothetical protein